LVAELVEMRVEFAGNFDEDHQGTGQRTVSMNRADSG
jgi:hypothetical protein